MLEAPSATGPSMKPSSYLTFLQDTVNSLFQVKLTGFVTFAALLKGAFPLSRISLPFSVSIHHAKADAEEAAVALNASAATDEITINLIRYICLPQTAFEFSQYAAQRQFDPLRLNLNYQ
jgi:hypothetical protein